MIDSLAALVGLGAQDPAFWMPLALMGIFFAILVAGVVLDGFDIGVGCLSLVAPAALRPRMLSLLGPWRDANEFWLFLGLGLWAVAFPYGWSQTLGRLYFPLSLLGLGTILRSVCFEWRLRAPAYQQGRWQLGFGLGAILVAFSHGYLLARVAVAYETGPGYTGFAVLMGLCAVAAYSLLGAAWLMMREAGELRARAVGWARRNLRWSAVGAVGLSVVLDFSNAGVFLKWGDGEHWSAVFVVWGGLLLCFVFADMILQRMIAQSYRASAMPYVLVLVIITVLLAGLAYSFFPYVVLDEVTLWDAAAPVATLRLTLSATVVAFPVALIFNLWVYWRMVGRSRAPIPPDFHP
ncbi:MULTISPECIES: cytochrome d ubiquinol oxidase subunit II [unclassified Castellaniella]|jgi:cytochrome d ubiquinol oxidase subunit II|uniref:cytochrome d ubiquinol oxidase subunit II n=1 Tax=unclassified Castellaniella TaxID=2617606 RepID=UPI003314FFE5